MKALILGAYGGGNIGDDTCRDVLLHFLKSRGVNAKWSSPPVGHDLVDWADITLLGGGGLLYDCGKGLVLQRSNPDFLNKFLRFLHNNTRIRIQKLTQYQTLEKILQVFPFITSHGVGNVDNYMSFLEWAFQQGKLTAGIALGTQGIYTEYGKRRYKQTLSKVDLLTVRDPTDMAVLESIGVSPKNGIVVCEDLGWLVEPPSGISVEFDVGWAIRSRPNKNKKYRQGIVSTVKELKKQGLTQYIVCFSRDDTSFLKNIAEEHDIPLFKNPHKEKTIIELSKCKMVVANRFHAVIFSLLLHKPVVVPYEHSSKNERLLRRINLPFGVSLFKPQAFKKKVLAVWRKKEALANKIDVTNFVAGARKNLILLDKLMMQFPDSR